MLPWIGGDPSTPSEDDLTVVVVDVDPANGGQSDSTQR
jgi:hypothetical protein